MTIDWANFTPLTALIGGCLIGLAAMMLMAVNGRIMGVSGILAGLILREKLPQDKNPESSDTSWRWQFVAGVVTGPLLVLVVTGAPIQITPVAGGWMLPVAGFLVGFGAAFGSGCTSGHGICGLARRSPRALIAVCSFMATGVLTVFVLGM